MFGRVNELVKDIEGILRIFLKENNYHVNLEKDDSQLEGKPSKETSPPVVHVQNEQPSVHIDLVGQEAVDDTTDNQVVDNFGEAIQDPPEIEIIAKMIDKEIGEAGKGEGEGKKEKTM